MLVLGALAATSSVGRVATVVSDRSVLPTIGNVTPPVRTPASATASRPPLPEAWNMPSWVGDIFRALIAALVLIVVVMFVRRLSWALSKGRRRAAHEAVAEGVEVPVVDEEQIVESLNHTIAQLRLGAAVDESILECWRQLEKLAADSGFERRDSQTAEEFTIALLRETRAHRLDLEQLAELYRRAMFSLSAPTASDRDAAVACLERIAEDLTREYDHA